VPVERPNIKEWQAPKWTEKNSTASKSITQSYLKATPIRKQNSSLKKAKSHKKDPFWQRIISLNFEKISLNKALDGLSKSYNFGYRNNTSKTIMVKHYRALKTPLSDVLQDLAQLTNTRFTLNKRSLVVTYDKAYWKEYAVNYPNIKRSSLSKTRFSQNIGSTQNNQNTGASVEITNESKNIFWGRLEKMLSTLSTVYQKIPATNKILSLSSTKLNNTQAQQTNNEVQILVHPETGIISVYGKQALHKQVKNILTKINQQARRQTHIEMAIMEVELNDQYQAGIDWSIFEDNNSISQQAIGANLGAAPRVITNITAVLDGISLNFGARLIEKFGDTKVLSSPQIKLINNQTALLKVVDNVVYFTIKAKTLQNTSGSSVSFETQAKSISVGLVITLTANILPDNSLIINLKPTISRIFNFVNDPHPELAKNDIVSPIPVLRERELESVLHIQPNEVAVIGGLIQNKDDKQSQHSPGSGGFVGFSSTEKKNTELILFLRANVID
jgi:general secretion pathway protein D